MHDVGCSAVRLHERVEFRYGTKKVLTPSFRTDKKPKKSKGKTKKEKKKEEEKNIRVHVLVPCPCNHSVFRSTRMGRIRRVDHWAIWNLHNDDNDTIRQGITYSVMAKPKQSPTNKTPDLYEKK